jgi:hypothetical protein
LSVQDGGVGATQHETVHAEFQDWEVITSFGVLNLKIDLRGNFVTDSLARLAQTFAVDPTALEVEFTDFRKTALKKHRQGATNYDAWKESVSAVDMSSSKTKARHHRQALREILARYGAFLGASTACCERSFSSLAKAVGPERSSMSAVGILNDLKLYLLAGTDCHHDEKIIDGAVKVWLSTLPPVRKSGKDRRTRWVSGLPTHHVNRTVETNFLAHRRSAVSEMSTQSKKRTFSDMQRAAVQLSGSAWSEGHAKVSYANNCSRSF